MITLLLEIFVENYAAFLCEVLRIGFCLCDSTHLQNRRRPLAEETYLVKSDFSDVLLHQNIFHKKCVESCYLSKNQLQ